MIQDAGTRPLPDAGPPPDQAGEVWDGYYESSEFPSGSDHLRIVFDSWSGTGPRTGTVVFGDPTPPDPPTNANVVYAPRGASPGQLLEGFVYHFHDAAETTSRVRFTYDLYEPWAAWCEIQFPVPVAPLSTEYTCVPGTMGRRDADGCWYFDVSDNAWVLVDCGRQAACSAIGGHLCACDASACAVQSNASGVIDFHVIGNDGMGTGFVVTRTRM